MRYSHIHTLVMLWLLTGIAGSTAIADIDNKARRVLTGIVTSSATDQPIPFVTVRVETTEFVTLTNEDGQFRLVLPQGRYRLKFSHIAYYTDYLDVNTEGGLDSTDISLRESLIDIGSTRVYAGDYDPAEQIILEAIRRKDDILSKLHDYSLDAYTKFLLYDIVSEDSSKLFLIAESQTSSYWEHPDKYKEVIHYRRQSANIDAENNLLSVGEILNFNKNRIEVGEYQFVSPTARDALDYYNYYLLDTLIIDDRVVFHLEIEPGNDYDPLFVGFIDIVDSTYDVVAVDVGVGEAVSFPFIDSVRYSQRFAPFENEYWMPIEIRFTANVSLGVPLPGIPSHMRMSHLASIYHYSFETGHPDELFGEYVIEVDDNADNYDSITWDAQQVIPLTQEEEDGYQYIDSVESAPRPWHHYLGRAALGAAFVLGGEKDLFRFNRVEGAYVGLPLSLGRPDRGFRAWARPGYAFEPKRMQHLYGAGYMLDKRRRLSFGIEYRNRVVNRPSVISAENFNPTFLALVKQTDPFDYYREKGMRVFVGVKPLDYTRLNLTYRDFRQKSQPIGTDYSLFDSEKVPRPNASIADGRLRSIELNFNFDSRKRYRTRGRDQLITTPQYTRFSAGFEISSPDLIETDFDFRRYHLRIFRRQRFFALGVSSLRLYVGSSDGDLPPQRFYVVDHGDAALFGNGNFATVNETNFVGNRVASLYLIHDFGRNSFARANFPLLNRLPIGLSIYGGLFWTDFRGSNTYRQSAAEPTIATAYSEIGFGLTRLAQFLRPFNIATYFTWQLSAYDTDKFSFRFDINL